LITTQVDQKGAIDLHEADAMLRMVYASRKADPLLLRQIDINGDGEVSMEELQQTVEEDNSVLAPAFQLQRMLRQRILGVRYWEQETLRRQTYFAGYDSGTTTSWDAIRDILAIKHRERLEEEERQRRLKEMEEEQRRQEKLQKELKFKEEMVCIRRPVSRRRGASSPGEELVGGFFFDFE
jgi:hypothetical protein